MTFLKNFTYYSKGFESSVERDREERGWESEGK